MGRGRSDGELKAGPPIVGKSQYQAMGGARLQQWTGDGDVPVTEQYTSFGLSLETVS